VSLSPKCGHNDQEIVVQGVENAIHLLNADHHRHFSKGAETMNDTIPSMGKSVANFTIAFILLAILVNVVLWLLISYAGMSENSGTALGWMPMIIGAMNAGTSYGTAAGSKPLSGYAWTASFIFMVVSVTLIALAWFGMSFFIPELRNFDFFAEMQRSGISLVVAAAIFGGLCLFIWVLLRFAFSFGAGQGIKMAQMKAQKK
jgi:hypothetical protein